jgi:hypothetical protein
MPSPHHRGVAVPYGRRRPQILHNALAGCNMTLLVCKASLQLGHVQHMWVCFLAVDVSLSPMPEHDCAAMQS